MLEKAARHDSVDWTQNTLVDAEYEGRGPAVKPLRVLHGMHEMDWEELKEDLGFGVCFLCSFNSREDLTEYWGRHGDDGGRRGDVEHIVRSRGG